jgi:hypothetical protein
MSTLTATLTRPPYYASAARLLRTHRRASVVDGASRLLDRAPPFIGGRATEAAVDAFLQLAGADGGGRLLDVDALLRATPRVVRWQFLCSLAARRRIAFHGTGDPHIERFEPREPVDFAPFGRQRAVFATSDPIWAMFYAIADRLRYGLTLNNGCLVLEDTGETYYYFSVSRQSLARRPWRTGYLYFLPGTRSSSSRETSTRGIRHASRSSRARSR